MEAIRALQRQLQEAQKASNVKKISERNCIDLVQKLIATEQVKIVHTANGKEWLTPEQIDQEIQDALAGSGGRLNVTELPGEVGVAIEHCEYRVDHLRKQDPSLRKIGGELLSSQYVQGVAQEVGESLEEAGCLAVADLAARYSLAADFIKEAVLPHVDAPGLVAKQNAIYTGTHAARVEARARGALRGCTEPAALSQLAGRHGLDVDLLSAAAQRALKAGIILGKLHGSTFTPKAYSDAQASRIDGFFGSNQYLLLGTAKSAGVEVKDWMRSKKPEGVLLSTAFVASQLVDSALASVSEALSAESWIDVQPLLPPALAEGDACELLAHLESGKKLAPGTMVLGRVAMSGAFVRSIASQFDAEVKTAAERAMSAPAQAKSVRRPAAAEEEEDEGGAKRKGKRAAKGKKGRAAGDGDGAAGDQGAGGGGGGGESGVEDQAIWDLLAEKYPEIPFEAHAELAERLQPLLAALVAEQQAALRSSLQSQQRALFEQAERLVQERYEALALGLRALEATGTQDSPLHQHLLREAVAEPLHRMLAARLQESTGATLEVTSASRKQCLDKLAAAEGSSKVASLSRLAAVFSRGKDAKDVKEAKEPKEDRKPAKGKKGDSKDAREDREEAEAAPADVSELYHAAAEDCHIYCRRVDKKREKAALQEKRAEFREKLKELHASEAVQALRLGLQLALLQDGVVGLLFPEELWAFRIVAKALADEAARDRAETLCGLLEAGDDAVALEAAVAEWRERALAGK